MACRAKGVIFFFAFLTSPHRSNLLLYISSFPADKEDGISTESDFRRRKQLDMTYLTWVISPHTIDEWLRLAGGGVSR